MVDLVQEAWKEHTCLASIVSHVNGLTQTVNNWGSVDQWLKIVDPLQWAWKPRVVIYLTDPSNAVYHWGNPHRDMTKKLCSFGFQVRERMFDALEYGASTEQKKWIVWAVNPNLQA
eukprot:9890508-Ditylum_brightwellii.AAC.1